MPLRRLRLLAAAGLAAWLAAGKLPAQTAPAESDPWLQPLAEYTRPAADENLPASEQQLEQILSLAATKSPTMVQQGDSVDAADAAQYRSWVRHTPVIAASYSFGMFYQATGTTGGSLTPGGTLTLQASQPLWHWGAFDAQTNLGLLRERLAQNEAILNYAKLCLDVRKRYYDLIVVKARQAAYPGEIAAAQRVLDFERLRLHEGRSTEQLVNVDVVALDKLEAQQVKATSDFDFQLQEFRRVTGSTTFSPDDIPDRIYVPVVDDPGLKTKLETGQKNRLGGSPLAAEEDLNGRIYDQQLIISRASRKPQLDFTASVSQTPYINSANNGLKFGTLFFIGLTGTWTVWDRGSSVAQDSALLAQKHQVETQYADLRAQTLNDASNSLSQIDAGVRLLANLKQQYAVQQGDYRQVQTLISLNRSSPTELDAARNALLDTRLQILTEQAAITDSYYSYISDIFQDPALANAPPFTKPR